MLINLTSEELSAEEDRLCGNCQSVCLPKHAAIKYFMCARCEKLEVSSRERYKDLVQAAEDALGANNL
jgi:hypothetical protein